MADGGKGSRPRPFSVSQEEFDNRWENIFGKKNKSEEKENSSDDKITDHSGEDQ